MAQTITLDMVLAKQKELVDRAMKLNDMNDGEAIMAEGQKLQQMGKELEAMQKVYEMQEKERLGIRDDVPEPLPEIVKVRLTDKQRERVLSETGVRMEVVELNENEDVLEEMMPDERPEYIEQKAIEKALKMRIAAKAEEEQRAKAMEAVEEIRKANDPELNRMLDEKMKDPDFLAGLIYKGK